MSATNRAAPRPLAQERPANLSLFAPERGALAQDGGDAFQCSPNAPMCFDAAGGHAHMPFLPIAPILAEVVIALDDALGAAWRWFRPPTSGDIGGKVIGWGTTQSAEAVAQTNAVTQNLTRGAVRQMVSNGLKRTWVEEQLAMYRTAALDAVKAAKNVQLAPRT
jgi:hypothetical protein